MSEDDNSVEGVVEVVASQEAKTGLARYWYLIVLAVVALLWFFSWWRYSAFTDEDYMPDQPIPYSHRLHAGEHQIPCAYCHFNAEKGRHAGVPPTSVCMGCHDPLKGAVGQGLPNVEKMLELIGDGSTEYLDTDDLDPSRDEGIVKEGGVIHWERIHKLPDHAYFSHEHHIAAGVSCQTCHGPIEEMEVVWQAEDLTMGWCIECHRKDDYTTVATKRSGLHDRAEVDENGMVVSEDYRVGTANYDVLRSRIRPDRVVPFKARHVKEAGGKGYGDKAHGDKGDKYAKKDAKDETIASALRGGFDGSKDSVTGEDVGFFTKAQAVELQKLFEKYPDLPRWRVPDLPESHRAFYGTEMLQNAPTQCSTCHQ